MKEKKNTINDYHENHFEKIEKSSIPGAILNQNIGHNSKKEGLGPNTKR